MGENGDSSLILALDHREFDDDDDDANDEATTMVRLIGGFEMQNACR